jgi:outer membrane protein OmpA-like peptidoglycan-associated protein
MSKAREQLLAGTVLSALVMAMSAHAAPTDGGTVLAQATPPQTEQDKNKPKPAQPPQRPQPPQQQRQAPPPPPPQQHQMQPPPPPPPPPQQRQMQPPPPPPPQQHQMQPPPPPQQQRQMQPPPPPPPQHQVQPPPGVQQNQMVPPRQGQGMQGPQHPGGPGSAPPAGAQQPSQAPLAPSVQQPGQPPRPSALPPVPGQPQQGQAQPGQIQQPGQFQRPGGQPPAPGQVGRPPGPGGQQFGQPPRPLGPPAIAPSALQPAGPPPGSPAAAAQRAFVPPPAQDNARRLDDLRGARHEVREGNRVFIEEPGRVIIREDGRTIIRHNEVDRFRWQARDVHIERRGADTVTVFDRPDGSRIFSITDDSGRLLRRYRRDPDGREIIIIDNRYGGPPMAGGYFVDLPPPVIGIPRDRYIVDTEYASPDDIYGALEAPPVMPIERAYSLDEVRYSPQLRDRMPRVDIDTVTFEFGSWEVTPDQVQRLAVVAEGINRAIAANPSEVFLIEGHTDAVGSDEDNLSLSDRRAESVALALSQQFQVPAENLTTQGYGKQYLKVPTQGPERLNRRVTVRRITPLLTGQNQGPPPPR